MKSEDFRWFKDTFGPAATPKLSGTPFTIDLLAAIAAQETGHIWSALRTRVTVAELLEVCVGDTLDADKGRKAFPRTADDLLAAPRGAAMFQIAHEALVKMAVHVPSFAKVAARPRKFCHGYGIFQYDLQFFETDPDYFLQRRWRDFGASLDKCVAELRAAKKRAGLDGKSELSELEMVHVAIAYNAGSFKPAKGLKQGHFDGEKFYGELVFDFLRLASSVASETQPAVIPTPAPDTAAISPPTPAASVGQELEVDVQTLPLRVRSEPRKDPSNIKAHLPDGHRVMKVSGGARDEFFKISTTLNGSLVEGFAASKFLVPVKAPAQPPPPPPLAAGGQIGAVFTPNKNGTPVKRTDLPTTSGARSLLEPGQPKREGATPEELRQSLAAIIKYLAVDKASHARYQPTTKATFCNLYAHDYCHLAGVYLPRVWWTPDAIERLARGETLEPRIGSTIDEQRANDLFRWLRGFGARFGWRQTGTTTKLQTEVNVGAVGLIIAMRKEDGKPGHVAMVVPETSDQSAQRDASGAVVRPLQSQAGRTNFQYGNSGANWWAGEQFADSAFWIHA